MRNGHAKTGLAVGFITVVDDAQNGLFGGYLILNPAGRPLEFHCTAPIRASRAQQILYGPTLEPYLFGEQIGHTLVTKSEIRPQVVCTDREPALAVSEFVDVPVILVLPADDDAPATRVGNEPDTWRLDAAHPGISALVAFRHGRNRLAVPEPDAGAVSAVTERLGQLPQTFDLAEPFERIRQAIDEARQGARKA